MTPAPAADGGDLSALLEQISERNEKLRHRYGHVGGLLVLADAREDVPHLVAAVKAVLKLAGQLEPQAPAASALEEDRMWIRQECADMIREAVRTALADRVAPGSPVGPEAATPENVTGSR